MPEIKVNPQFLQGAEMPTETTRYSLWLHPAVDSAEYEQMQSAIINTGDEHDGPVFLPHVTIWSFTTPLEPDSREEKGLLGILRTLCRQPQAKACKTSLEFGPVEISETWNQNLISLSSHRATTEALGELNVLAQQWFPRDDDDDFCASEHARFSPPCKKPHISYLYGNHKQPERKAALDYVRQSTQVGFGVKFEGAFLSIVRTGGGGLGWPQGVDAVKHWKEVARCKLGGEQTVPMGNPEEEAANCPDMNYLKGLGPKPPE